MPPFVEFVTRIISTFVVLGDALIVFLIVVFIAKKLGYGEGFFKSTSEFFGERAFAFSFVIVLSSVVGSLFYSEVANFLPCVLCWWQRVFLYPLVFIFGVALVKKDISAKIYGLILSAVGGIIALYHSYIQFGGAQFIPCDASGVSCAQRFFLEYGYVTIPTMSLTAFAMIFVLLLFVRRESSF